MAEIENLQIVGGAIYTVGNQDIIADDWEAGKTYIKDRSYAIKDHKLYQCAVSHTSVEPFDPTKWTEKTVAEALGTAGSANMIECTLAEYTAWKAGGQLINETVYVITDAPNLNATAQDISYDGGVDTVWDKVESKSNLLTTEDFTTTFSVNANTDVAVNFDITKSGYTPLGVVFYTIGNKDCFPHAIFLTNTTTATFHISNISASAKSNISAKVTILFVKN